MKGFGDNDKTNKKSLEKKTNSLQKDKLISNALLSHARGEIKEALEMYNFLIQNKHVLNQTCPRKINQVMKEVSVLVFHNLLINVLFDCGDVYGSTSTNSVQKKL